MVRSAPFIILFNNNTTDRYDVDQIKAYDVTLNYVRFFELTVNLLYNIIL